MLKKLKLSKLSSLIFVLGISILVSGCLTDLTPRKFDVTFEVVDVEGSGIEEAEVMLDYVPRDTDENGIVRFNGVEAGTYDINVSAEGYEDKNERISISRDERFTIDLEEEGINIYEVIFENYDGSEIARETVDYGSDATAPADPSREGYIFTGWDTDFDDVREDIRVRALYVKDDKGNLDVIITLP